MAVEFFVNNKQVELKEGTRLQFNYAISDIFSLGYVRSSYSNVFDAPFTPENTLALNGLGLTGDTSEVPYTKTVAVLKQDGFDIIRNGWLTLEETGINYRMGVLQGVYDFFKDVENKTLGNDLDISALDHDKTVDNFKGSLNDNYLYRYVVANFGGKTALPSGVINIDYLIPVVKLSYFWNKIFQTFGYTYSGSIFSNPDYKDAYITYPKAPSNDAAEEVVVSTAFKNQTIDTNPVQIGQSGSYSFPNSYNWDVAGPGFGVWNYTVLESKKYRIRCRPSGYLEYGRDFTFFYFSISVGNKIIKVFKSKWTDTNFDDYFIDIDLIEGQTLSFEIYGPNFGRPDQLRILSLELGIYELSSGNFDFTSALSDFSIKDFVKEIINRFALTVVYDDITKNLAFYTAEEKINFNNTVDWTEKYSQRTKESYLYGQYAQRNLFKHKYNDEEENFNDGEIKIQNQNLEITKDIVSSKTYSPESRITNLTIGVNSFSTPVYRLWNTELREDDNGSLLIDYKGLNGRYYIMKLKRVDESLSFKSEVLESDIETTSFFFVPNANNTHYNDLVPKYYKPYEKMLNNFRMHEIELVLSLPDVLNIDFTKLYYFEQEANLYMLNKLTWEEGKMCKGEFIKVNK